MFIQKIKSYTESISTLRFLGMRNYLIVDVHEQYVSIALLKSVDNPFKVLIPGKLPKAKIIHSHKYEFWENISELNKEINLLIDKNKIKNAVLVLILTKYKRYVIKMPKQAEYDDSELGIEELIRKQLPDDVDNHEFVVNFQKSTEDESFDNYIVTITRKPDIEKYLSIIQNDSIKLKLAIPFIYAFSSQLKDAEVIRNLVEFQKERIVHYHLEEENKITEEEYWFDQDALYKSDKFEGMVRDNFNQIIESIHSNRKNLKENLPKLYIQAALELKPVLNKTMIGIISDSTDKINYEFSQHLKHQLMFYFLFNDRALDFKISDNSLQQVSLDIERAVTTRFVTLALSSILALLLILNAINWLVDSSLSDLLIQNQSREKLQQMIEETTNRNDQLKSDIKFVDQFKLKKEIIARLLKIISESKTENLFLNSFNLKKGSTGKYELKMNGESYSRDGVVSYIRNLESQGSLSDIELIWLNKKKSALGQSVDNNASYEFSIHLIYNENKNI